MKNIHVIIPVVQTQLADNLLNILVRNTVRPKKIIIIDNSEKDYLPPEGVTQNIDTEVHHYSPPKKVNESWKIGFEHSKNADIVSILNDDIIVSRYFFEKILIVFDRRKNAAITSPYTRVPPGIRGTRCKSGNEFFPKTSSPLSNKIMEITFRQGWAFSIRREILDKIPPIPEEMPMFCGDDWLFLWSLNMRFKWYLMLDNRCFHYTGTSVKKIHFLKRTILQQKQALLRILKNNPNFNQNLIQYVRGVREGVRPIESL